MITDPSAILFIGASLMKDVVFFFLKEAHFCLYSLEVTSRCASRGTDQARSKIELVAENALLRKPLVMLRRQVKQPTCTKSDRMLLMLLARMVRTWQQALLIVQEDDAPAVASSGM